MKFKDVEQGMWVRRSDHPAENYQVFSSNFVEKLIAVAAIEVTPTAGWEVYNPQTKSFERIEK